MNLKNLLILFSLLVPAICGCSGKQEEVLDKKEAVSLLTDLRITQAMFDTGQGQKTGFKNKEEAEMAVLRSHGVTPEKYRKTLEWYGANLDKYDKVNQEVNKRIAGKLKETDPNAAGLVDGDNNIWPYADHIMFTPISSSDGLTLSIGDPHIEKGGYTELKANINDVNTNMAILLGVEYEDGSMTYTGRSSSGFQQIKVRVQTDSSRNVRRLFGYLRPVHELTHNVVLDSISLIKMPYDSLEYYRITAQTNLKK